MKPDEAVFYVSVIKPSYPVVGLKSYTLDDIWNSEKCWYMRGDRVLIKDSHGNKKIFVKE